jgi:uncharacterized membrane protein YhaH (DUF805 family)
MRLRRLLFSLDGVLTQKQYWVAQAITYSATPIILFYSIFVHPTASPRIRGVAVIVTVVVGLLSYWIGVATALRRLRACNRAVEWSVFLLIPKVRVIAMIAVGVLKSPTEDQPKALEAGQVIQVDPTKPIE